MVAVGSTITYVGVGLGVGINVPVTVAVAVPVGVAEPWVGTDEAAGPEGVGGVGVIDAFSVGTNIVAPGIGVTVGTGVSISATIWA